MLDVRPYIDSQGHNPFQEWYEQLDNSVRTRVASVLDRLERGSIPAKTVGGGVMELRLDVGPGYRLYVGRDGERLILLLGGGTKKRQHLDIAAAQNLWREYKQQK
jgi:putative addiction module killer protein